MNVPLNMSTFENEEISAAIKVLESGFFTMGSKCLEFEEKFANFVGSKNAIFVNSGSSANLLAFFALANFQLSLTHGQRKITSGCEVIVPAVTWSTTIWPVIQAGAIPVLVDCDPKTLQMKPESVRAAISEKTVGIVPVHVLGNSCDMDQILEMARENKLWVLEDTCESLGTKFNGRYVGTLGLIGTYSFFFSHHISTIEGGMLVTDDDALAEICRAQRAHGWSRHLKNRKSVESLYPDVDPRFLFVNTGFNLRPTEINAAIGLVQIDKLNKFNGRRQEIAERWTQAFAPLIKKGCFSPMVKTEGADCTWFGYPIILKTKELRDQLKNHLEAHGVETRPIICGNLARQPVFKNIPNRISGQLHGADQIMDQGLFWGSHPLMKPEEVEYIIEVVEKFFRG